MSVEPDKKRIAELEQRVADLESGLAKDHATPLIVPKAITFARIGLILSFIIIVIGIGEQSLYIRHMNVGERPRIASEDSFFLFVPAILYPILCSVLGIFVLRGLQRGKRWGQRLAFTRIWLTLPLALFDTVVIFWAGLMLWPRLDLVMLSIVVYLFTEIFFVVAGILSWRAHKTIRKDETL